MFESQGESPLSGLSPIIGPTEADLIIVIGFSDI